VANRGEQFLVVHGLDLAADRGNVARLADAELHRDRGSPKRIGARDDGDAYVGLPPM
jgi:hypothetical protein